MENIREAGGKKGRERWMGRDFVNGDEFGNKV
jgi:hypothetical protein